MNDKCFICEQGLNLLTTDIIHEANGKEERLKAHGSCLQIFRKQLEKSGEKTKLERYKNLLNATMRILHSWGNECDGIPTQPFNNKEISAWELFVLVNSAIDGGYLLCDCGDRVLSPGKFPGYMKSWKCSNCLTNRQTTETEDTE